MHESGAGGERDECAISKALCARCDDELEDVADDDVAVSGSKLAAQGGRHHRYRPHTAGAGKALLTHQAASQGAAHGRVGSVGLSSADDCVVGWLIQRWPAAHGSK